MDWQFALWAVVIFIGSFLASLLVGGVFLIILPASHFLDTRSPRLDWGGNGAVGIFFVALKNLLGLALVVFGVFLSIPGIPGQGVLTVLMGIVLLDIPGKRRVERSILRRPGVLKMINRLRERFARPPLLVGDSTEKGEASGESMDQGIANGSNAAGRGRRRRKLLVEFGERWSRSRHVAQRARGT